MKILILYFSYTGNVRTLAEAARKELERVAEVTVQAIEPQRQRGYWGWLARSFVPGWGVPIFQAITDLAPYDLVCFGFPKWTFNCPPITEYLRQMRCAPGQKFALFMSFGGFDEERYMKNMVRRVTRRGVSVVAMRLVRRRAIRQGLHREAIGQLCGEAIRALRPKPDSEG